MLDLCRGLPLEVLFGEVVAESLSLDPSVRSAVRMIVPDLCRGLAVGVLFFFGDRSAKAWCAKPRPETGAEILVS